MVSFPPSDRAALDLPRLFLADARAAYLDGTAMRFGSIDLIWIVQNPNLRRDFVRRFRTEVNDPDLKREIVRYLRDTAVTLDDATDYADSWVDLLDRYVAPISGSVGVAGIVALAGTAAVAAPFLLGGGLLALGVCGTTRMLVKTEGNRSKTAARRIRVLMDELGEVEP